MRAQWNQYARTIPHSKAVNYDDFHTEKLFVAVMEDVEEATVNLGIFKRETGTIASLFNEAWDQFRRDADRFLEWKEDACLRLSIKIASAA
jgi:hypothetical protein